MAKKPFESSPLIEGKFRVLTHLPILHTPIGSFDFRTITLEDAEKVSAIAPEYIEKIKPKRISPVIE